MGKENPYTERARLELVFIQKGNYEYDKIIEAIDKEIEDLERRIVELKNMPIQEFMKMIARRMFGVASKDFYIMNYRKTINTLIEIKRSIDYMIDLYQNDRRWFEWVLTHSYKGKVREMRRAIQKIVENKQTRKLTVFA